MYEAREESLRSFGSAFGAKPASWTYLIAAIVIAVSVAVVLFFTVDISRTITVRGAFQLEEAEVRVRPPKAGFISRCHVRNGEDVKAGDILITIDTPSFLNDGVASTDAEITYLNAQRASVMEQLQGLLPKLEIDKKVWKTNTYSTKRALEHKRAELEHLARSRAEAEARLKGAEADLVEGLGVKSTVFQRRDALDGIDRSILQIEAEIDALLSEVSRLDNDVQRMDIEYQTNKAVLERALSQIQSELVQLQFDASYALKSTISGVVTGSSCKVGEAVAVESAMMIIVPANSKLIGELTIPSSAAGNIENGQRSLIRVDAFPYREFGFVRGIISDASIAVSDPIPLENSTPRYRVVVSLDEQTVRADGVEHKIKPGMEFSADITLDQRTLGEWFLGSLVSGSSGP